MPQKLIIGTLISQFALYSALFRSLHSSISKEQHEKYHYDPSSHNRKYGEYGREMRTPKINYWKTHKPVCFVLSYVLSVTQQHRQSTAWKANLQSIQPLRRIQKIYSWNTCPISWYVKAITSQFQLCRTRHSKQGIAREVAYRVLYWSHSVSTANHHLTQLWRKEWGIKGVHPPMQAL